MILYENVQTLNRDVGLAMEIYFFTLRNKSLTDPVIRQSRDPFTRHLRLF